MSDTALILRNQALIMLALANYLRLTDPVRTTQDCLHLTKAAVETTDRYTELKEIKVGE